MNLLFKLSGALLLAGLLLTSCTKENTDEIIIGEVNYEPEEVVVNNLMNALTTTETDGLELGCLSIDFPFTLLLEDGSTVEVFTLEEFEAAASMEPPFQVVDFVFPLLVTTEDGTSAQVNNNEELGLLFGACIPDDGWDDTTTSSGSYTIPAFLFEELCFDLIYPVEVMDADENTYTATSEAGLIDLLATTPNLSFVLPITVVDDAGDEHLIETVAGFYDLYYSCEGVIPPGTEGGIVIDFSELDSTDCDFETLAIQYPYNVVTDAGELITVENENQEAALILSGAHYTIQYPFNLVDADGAVTTINDEMEFIQLILPCLVVIDDPAGPCDTDAHVLLFFNAHNIFTVFDCPFDINYPVDVTVDGTPVTLNSVDDYFAETGAPNNIGGVELVYPITVTVAADGSTVTLNNDQEVCAFIETCE
jgi:hypothetical protein